MDPYLVAQIEAGNHARLQQAHMYSDAANYESARQAHMQEARSAARSRSQRQRQGRQQQPSGHCETSKSFPPLTCLPFLFQQQEHANHPDPGPDPEARKTDDLTVPESNNDDRRTTRRSTRSTTTTQRDAPAAAAEPAEDMRAKLARINVMSGGLGDRDEQQRGKSSRREAESSYRASESSHRPIVFHCEFESS